jgi:hypothetical protein
MMKQGIRFLILSLLFVFTPRSGRADPAQLQASEDSLRKLASLVFHCKTDESRTKANTRFLAFLGETLKLEGSFEYPFDSLKDIGKLKAPDATFRIYDYNLQKDDGSMVYYGFIQRINPKTKKTDLFELNDKSSEIKNPESQSLDCKKWFGALYYKIIRNKSGPNIYYTLLGWDGHNNMTWRKLIEVLWFDKEGSPHFGESIFVMGKLPKKRVVFEFRAEMIMALKYNEEKGMIIFDNLAPESPEGKGIYETYVMDGSYNGFVFKKGKWQYIPDVNALNPKSPNDKFYEDPRGESDKKGSNTMGPPQKKKAPDPAPAGPK